MHRTFVLFALLPAAPTFLLSQADHHHHAPEAAESAGKLSFQPLAAPDEDAYELGHLVEIALEKNPTIEQGAAGIERAEGIRRQAGKYPNPTIGATGDENTPNSTFRGGEVGMFIEQRIVTAGKLGLTREIAAQRKAQAEAADAAQRQRVRNSVRGLFYACLGTQWLVDVHERLLALTEEAVDVTRELANVGQADRPDVLRGEIEAQRSRIEVRQATNAADRAWSQLALVAGASDLERKPLRGDLETYPRLDRDAVRQRLLQESPELRFAEADRGRADLTIERARVDKWPDIMVHGGFRNSPFIGRDGRPVGREGFFDVGVEIPMFDRRKGTVQAARADARRAELEVDRLKLELESRLAEEYQEYEDARAVVDILRDEMLPRAVEAHDAYRLSFERMAAAYPQVLIAKRSLLELEKEYAEALVAVWDNAVHIEGLLLSGGLEAPGAAAGELMDSGSDADRLTPTALRRHR